MTAGQSMPEEEVALVVPGAPFRVYLRTGVKELVYLYMKVSHHNIT